MPGFKSTTSRKRLTENASASRIAEANEVWHSTAIHEVDEDSNDNADHFMGTPIKVTKTKADRGSTKGKTNNNERDSGRGRSTTHQSGERSITPGPVVINAPSGHSFLSSVLQRCGYIIRQPVTNNEMFHDVMKFRKTMSDWIVDNEDEMKRIETDTAKFFKALDAYLSEKPNFTSSMKPTKHETELIQPSLLNCLLGIEAIQVQVLRIVFAELGEASLTNTEEDISLINTILNQLKWLPSIVDGKKFAESLLSITDTASTNCQSLIIKFLPDILPSSLHPQVAEKLLDKFNDSGSQLNIAMMDCFSSLDIPDSFWSNIRNTAIDQMTTASIQDIPAYFSFLFRTEGVGALNDVITTMREKVKLVPENRSAKLDACQVEILEKVGFCITVNPNIVKLWSKQVKDDLQHSLLESITKIDLLMLLIFLDSSNSSVPTLKLLFAERQHTMKLFGEIMKHNKAMMFPIFPAISKFLDSLLRGRDTKFMDTVCEMTVQLFTGLSAETGQVIMSNLTNILVNFPQSRETVLQILTQLAEQEPTKLLVFSPYLMAVLEYVMQFPAGQIRSLMNVLAVLAQTEGSNTGKSNHFSSEFSILLRKQLTHPDIKIRCFGVFGALASIRRMTHQTVSNDIHMRELLKLAWSFVERDEDACSIFLDELSACTESLPIDICTTYREILRRKFEQLWTIDATSDHKIEEFKQRNEINLVSTFDANKECTEERLIINFENHPLSMSPLVIPAHLRALSLLEMKVEPSQRLTGIDALLGCPILFPALQDYFERDSINDFKYNQRCLLGQYLVLAINFFRESICAFVEDSDLELRVKVWLRLENVLKLQKNLVKHFDSFPTLPHAYIAEKTIGSKDGAGPSGLQAYRTAKEQTSAKPKKPKAAPKKSARKKPRRENSNSESEDDDDSNAAPVVQKKGKISLDEEIQPKKIICHLRRLDKSVFQLLRCPLRSKNENVSFSRILLDLSSVSQNPSTLKEVEMLNPETLVLLLAELRRQVHEQPPNINILKVKGLLRNLCSYINAIQVELLKHEENDMAEVTDDQSKLESCLRIIIDVLITYFEAIKKLEKEAKEKVIQKSIHILASQAVINSEDDVEMSSQGEVLANVANYLGGLVSVIKDSSTALDHLKLLKIVHDILGGHPELKKAIDNAARGHLRGEWKLPAAKVDGFLKIWLSTTVSPMKVITHLVSTVLNSDAEEDSVFDSTVYKSCNASNFHIWYTAMLVGVSQHVYKTLRRRGDFEDCVKDWIEAVNVFKSLVAVTQKEIKLKNLKNFILVALLKHCRMFLEAFISGGAELLPRFWKEDTDAAQTFCKALQAPCRILQHICEHSKIQTNVQLLKSVPLVKRVLETLVFRVREVLGVHGVPNAFWMGSLKHRDLKGVCISSQIQEDDTLLSDEDESENEDEVQAARLSGMTETDGLNEDSMDIDVNADSEDE